LDDDSVSTDGRQIPDSYGIFEKHFRNETVSDCNGSTDNLTDSGQTVNRLEAGSLGQLDQTTVSDCNGSTDNLTDSGQTVNRLEAGSLGALIFDEVSTEGGFDSSDEEEPPIGPKPPVARNFNNTIKYARKETILQRRFVGDPKDMPTSGENFNNHVEVGGQAKNSTFLAEQFINGQKTASGETTKEIQHAFDQLRANVENITEDELKHTYRHLVKLGKRLPITDKQKELLDEHMLTRSQEIRAFIGFVAISLAVASVYVLLKKFACQQ
jgi:hypothetical protein